MSDALPRRVDTARAAASSASGAAQRRHPADDIDLAARDLEQLARDMRQPDRSHAAIHDQEERAQAIAASIVATFRGGREPRVLHAPLRRVGTGALW